MATSTLTIIGTAEGKGVPCRTSGVPVPQKVPVVVLSRDEVARLIDSAPNLRSQTALSIATARYSYEMKGGSYDIGAVRTLADELLKAVMAHGLKKPH